MLSGAAYDTALFSGVACNTALFSGVACNTALFSGVACDMSLFSGVACDTVRGASAPQGNTYQRSRRHLPAPSYGPLAAASDGAEHQQSGWCGGWRYRCSSGSASPCAQKGSCGYNTVSHSPEAPSDVAFTQIHRAAR